jgi:hypothetical protein
MQELEAEGPYMLKTLISAIVISSLAALAAAPAFADGKKTTRGKSNAEGKGGYSYKYSDSINTYGDGRSTFGGASSLRDPMLDRQTKNGPFDHGFFFDSGMGPRGGDSPYMN